MAEPKTKRFALSILGPGEQVPRLVTAVGTACGGQFGLVLRPTEKVGVLVHLRKDGASFWAPGADGDAPRKPASPTTDPDAVQLVKTLKGSPPSATPVVLKGAWKGFLVCDDQAPRVELTRKVAAYGSLTVTSSASGWTWKVEREGRWFAGATEETAPKAVANLADAIGQGVAALLRVAGQACATRDTHRRGALDSGAKPVVPPKERTDRTDQLGTKKAAAGRRRAAEDTAPKPDRDIPTGVPGLVLNASVGGFVTGDRAVLNGASGTVTGVRSTAQTVRWKSDADGKERWVQPSKLQAPGAATPTKKPAAAPPKAPAARTTKPKAGPDAGKDQRLMDLFAEALKGVA